jgi:methyl-accepting chemotaxis protein
MPQESVSPETLKVGKALSVPSHKGGLKRKIITTFSGLILVLGFLVIGVVYYLTGNALRKQVDLRATAIATNLSDAAAGIVSRKSALEADALIAKYGRLEGVAYAYIQDPKGGIVASSVQPFPSEIKDSSAITNRRVSSSRVANMRGRPVLETQVPLLDGQLGTAHVGLWADAVQQEVHATVLQIVALVGICLILGILAAAVLAGRTTRPILELKSIADRISRGQLDTAISFDSNDEIGDLARSLERMRASLKAAMTRLNRA